jgi:phosphoglycolate phosphatase-like HAD superfamily hydrolase
MVGDSEADINAARAAGINIAAVKTGKNDPSSLAVVKNNNIPVFENFAAFVEARLKPLYHA